MKQYQLWNKTSPINGVSATTILEYNPTWRDATDIYLISDSTNPTQITNIEKASIIRTINADWSELTDAEVMTAYCLMLDGQSTLSSYQDFVNVIKEYDASEDINSFYVGENGLWLTPAERASFLNYLNAKITLGGQVTDSITYILGEVSLTITIAEGLAMLAAIEVYAGDCAIITAQHIAYVQGLPLADAREYIELEAYKEGYPTKLSYSL